MSIARCKSSIKRTKIDSCNRGFPWPVGFFFFSFFRTNLFPLVDDFHEFHFRVRIQKMPRPRHAMSETLARRFGIVEAEGSLQWVSRVFKLNKKC